MKKTFTLVLLLFVFFAPVSLMAQGGCITSLPWSDNFENCTDVGGNSLPTCWTRPTPFVNSSATYPNVYSFGSTHGKVLNFNGQAPAGQNGTMAVATPLIPAPLNSLELSFTVYKSGLKVYVATDPTDANTYTLVGSYSPGYVWTTYEVHTDTVTTITQQGYIVFQGVAASSGYSNAYLDDLTISSINNCDRPASVNVDMVTPTTADLSWPAATSHTSYVVNYSTGNTLAGSNMVTVTGTSTTLTGLTPGSNYNIWVRTVCAPGDSSDARTATLTTELSCYTITNLEQVGSSRNAASFQWEFDGHGNTATDVWTVLHDITDPTGGDVESLSSGTNSHIFTNLDHTHNYQAAFYTICGNDTSEAVLATIVFRQCGESEVTGNTTDYSADFPFSTAYGTSFSQVLYNSDVLFSMDTIRGIALHRRLGISGSTLTRTLTIRMGHSSLDSLTTSISNTTGLTLVAHNVSYSLPGQEWDTLLFTTPFVYNGRSNVLVVIADSTGSGTSLNSAAQWLWHPTESKTWYKYGTSSVTGTYKQPDIRFVGDCNDDLVCDPPVAAMGDIDSITAQVTWVGEANAPYVVEYRTEGSNNWTIVDTVINIYSYTLTGLTPSTYYETRVGVICDTVTRYSAVVNFVTVCALFHLPFHFSQTDMVAVSTNGLTDCWNHSQYFYRGRLSDSHRGFVRNAGNGEWFMLPAIAEPLSGARLRTWVGSSDVGSFKVGIASLSNCSDVVWIDTIDVPAGNPNTSHDEYVCYLDRYTGTGNRVVVSPIVNNNYHYIYFFDFHLEPIEGCRPVLQLTCDSSDASSISFHWTPVSSESQWLIFVDGTLTDTVNNTPHYTATGLEPFTNYDITVRPLCGVDETGDATTVRMQTGCAGEECQITIYGHSATGDGWNGARLQVLADSTLLCNFTLSNGNDNMTSQRICADMHVTLNWLTGNADQVCSFEVINSNDDTLFIATTGIGLSRTFFETDSVCHYTDTTTVGPGPGPGVCLTPAGLSASATGSETGTASWIPVGEETEWQVRILSTHGEEFLTVSVTNLTLENLEPATSYQVSVRAICGEGDTSDWSNIVFFTTNEAGIGSPNALSSLLLYPNPASNHVTVSGLVRGATVMLYDLNGREVYRSEASADSVKVAVGHLTRGIYFVRIITDQESATRRLTVR